VNDVLYNMGPTIEKQKELPNVPLEKEKLVIPKTKVDAYSS
jgi:hypothetical protein